EPAHGRDHDRGADADRAAGEVTGVSARRSALADNGRMRTLSLLLAVLLVPLSGCAGDRGVSGGPMAATTMAESHQGRAIQARTYGRGPTRVYLIASIHGDEPEGRESLASLEQDLVLGTGDATVRLVGDMN